MKGLLTSLLFALLVIASTASAQNLPIFDSVYLITYGATLQSVAPNTMDFNGGGARAHGMGGAFLGVSDDVTAVSWNPAGLFQRDNPYEQPVVAFGYQSMSTDASFRDNPWGQWDQFDFNKSFSGTNLMTIVFPARISGHAFVASISYTRLGDEAHNTGMQLDTVMFFDFADQLAGIERPFHYNNLVDYDSHVNALNVGFGTRLYKRLSFGLAINAYGGKSSEYVQETIQWDSLIIPGAPRDQRGTGVVRNQVYDTTSYSGVFFTLGFKFEGDKTSAGLVFKTPHTLKQSTDVFLQSEGSANGVVINGFGRAVHFDDNVIELDQPLTIGLGVGQKLRDNLLLAADVEYRAFGGGRLNVRDSLELVPGGTDIEYFTEVDMQWNDTWVVRVGGEYIWNTGNRIFPTVPLRAGFGYVQIPSPDIDGYSASTEEYVTSTAAMTRWSLGSGVRWAQVHIDVAWVNNTLDQVGFFQSSGARSADSELSVDNSTWNVTFTGFF